MIKYKLFILPFLNRSIYDGDSLFSVIENKKIQYKLGEDGTAKSFILEINWTDEYPEVLPDISLDAFYNKHIIPSVKEEILEFAKTEGEQYLGMPMTYTIIEQVKENLENLLKDQPEHIEASVRETSEEVDVERTTKETSPRKEHLTKAQKRKMWNKGGLDTDDRERGWNWYDVIKHLSQTGPASES